MSIQSIRTVRWIRKVAEQVGSSGGISGMAGCQGMIVGQILLKTFMNDGQCVRAYPQISSQKT